MNKGKKFASDDSKNRDRDTPQETGKTTAMGEGQDGAGSRESQRDQRNEDQGREEDFNRKQRAAEDNPGHRRAPEWDIDQQQRDQRNEDEGDRIVP